MLPSNLNLNVGKPKGYNNKILVSNKGMEIGPNRDIKDHKKFPVVKPDVLQTVIPVAQHDPVGAPRSRNLRMLTEKHNDEKLAMTLLIVGGRFFAYHF